MSNQFLSESIEIFDIDFNQLDSIKINEAYEQLLVKATNDFNAGLSKSHSSFEDFFSDKNLDKLMALHGLVGSLNSLISNDELRDLEEKFSPILSQKLAEWSLNKVMFDKICDFSKTKSFDLLPDIRKKMITKIIKDLTDSGIALSEDKKSQLINLKSKLSTLVQKFQNNITDAQASFSIKVKLSELTGLPARSIDTIKGLNPELNIFKDYFYINESSGLLSDVMIYSDNPKIRKKIYDKRKCLCTKGKYSNIDLIDKIYKIKQDIAAILGYSNYAEMVLEDNMAKNSSNVLDFLEEVGGKAYIQAKQEANYILQEGNKILNRPVEWWDHEYICNKILKSTYSVDTETVRSYLPVDHVLSKLFELCDKYFNLSFVLDPTKSVWNEDVKYYDVFENNVHIGGIFFDLYKREGKSPGAWLNPISSYENNTIKSQKPYCLLVCNTPKSSNSISTFDLNEVITLFHEMGHAVHHLLSKVSEEYYSGFNNVEHDGVEIPSQLFENLVYNQDILKFISKNINDGTSLPENIINNIVESRKFLGATSIINMVKFSEMDMKLYTQNIAHPFDLEIEAMKKWQLVDNTDFDRKRMASFGHIFGGGYSAGYYSYQWAEVYAIDGYQHIIENGAFSPETIDRFKKYKENILYTGGEFGMKNNYLAFRGSDPKVENYINFYL